MDDCWEDPNQKGLEEDRDSSDEDYSPFLHLRYVSVSSCISGWTTAMLKGGYYNHKYFGLSGEDNVLGEHDAVVPFWSSNWFYVHILLLCSAPAMTANINQLLEISMDKAVLDVATPNPPGEDIQETPEQQKVSGMPL